MENFKEIAELVLRKDIKGYFVIRTGAKIKSDNLVRLEQKYPGDKPYYMNGGLGPVDENGCFSSILQGEFDIVDFIQTEPQ